VAGAGNQSDLTGGRIVGRPRQRLTPTSYGSHLESSLDGGRLRRTPFLWVRPIGCAQSQPCAVLAAAVPKGHRHYRAGKANDAMCALLGEDGGPDHQHGSPAGPDREHPSGPRASKRAASPASRGAAAMYVACNPTPCIPRLDNQYTSSRYEPITGAGGLRP
jgi:hypothetical protein